MFSSIFEDTMVTGNWQQVQRAGEEKQPVLFPLGVIEEHGPHLPLGADIYWSAAMCRLVKERLGALGQKCVIGAPYYWGVNYCTGGFPGSFSLKPETMQQVLFEIFENLKDFGFSEIYCFSYHGDSFHVRAIAEAIKRVNAELGIHVRLVLESMDLRLYGWQGDEEFLLVSNPDYPMEWFEEQEPSEAGLLDIHAGAFETAVLNHFCPEQVNLELAKELKSSSLSKEGMKKWLQGGESTREVVPLGYAGNPAGYQVVSKHVEEMLALQSADIAMRILKKGKDND
ncbi:MAG: creatininase family protein [Lachnospiraceae bacterium]|nr:creatininase family protein [Lachnospiraceae bacterium]